MVNRIAIEGTRKTNPAIIRNVMTLSEGDSVEVNQLPSEIVASRNNIYNLGIFTDVWVSVDSSLMDSLVIRVRVQERWYIWPIPTLRLEERTFNEWWQDKDLDRLVYGMGVEWNNFTGRADQLLANVQGGYSRFVSMNYALPFLLPKAGVDAAISFQYLNNKEIGYATRQGIYQLARLTDKPMRQSVRTYFQLSKRFNARQFLNVGIQYDYFRPDDSIRFFNPEYLSSPLAHAQYPSAYISILDDQRDVKAFPLKGYKFFAQARQTGLPGLGTHVFSKFNVNWIHYLPLSERWNLAYNLQGWYLLGKKVPFFDKNFLGFLYNVRGYERYVIDGSAIGVAKTEVKYGVIKRQIAHLRRIPWQKFQDFPVGLYLSGHADAGYVRDGVNNNPDGTFKDKWLVGYGLGLNFYTVYDLLVRVEVSRNIHGTSGLFFSGVLALR